MWWLLALCLSALAGDLKVHVLDVGQGDAILIEAANGKRVLVDAGTRKANVAGMLKARGIERLDMVVASHPHADHIGGMADVIDAFKPRIFVDNSMTHTTLTYSRTMGAVRRNEVAYRPAIHGRRFNLDTDVQLLVLHPRSRRLTGTRSDLNSNSVVIRIEHEDDCILLTGDAEDPTERSMMGQELAPCEVLKVAHHGSGHSTSSAWLRAIQPRIALISAGKNNRYGHPDAETLSRLASAEVEIHRTDLEGTLTVLSTGRGVTVSAQREPAVGPAGAPEPRPAPTPSVALAPGDKVNINIADAATLDALPGIGPARAAAIIEDRKSNGPYIDCSALQRVHGIGPKTVAGLAPQCITAAPESP